MLRNTLQLNFVLGLSELPCKVQICNVKKAEANERSKSYHNQYKDILELANYFKNEDVTWLSDHFYHSSLKIAAKGKFYFL